MKVKELIQKLLEFDKDLDVDFQYRCRIACRCEEYCYCDDIEEQRSVGEAVLLKDGTKNQVNGGDKIVLKEY